MDISCRKDDSPLQLFICLNDLFIILCRNLSICPVMGYNKLKPQV